jgi:CheY-like chemotaxis protein
VIHAVIVSEGSLEDQLRDTLLFRHNVARIRASGVEEVKRAVQAGPVDIVIVDASLPDAPAVVAALRREPLTRGLSIAGLGHSDVGLVLVQLIDSGVNAVLSLPPGADWDDRLMQLVHVPARKVTRFPVSFAVGVGRGDAEPFEGRALNLSVHGLLLLSSFPLEIGEDVGLGFHLPNSKSKVRGTGTVVRLAQPEGVGIELTSVEGDGRVLIKRFVEAAPRIGVPGL